MGTLRVITSHSVSAISSAAAKKISDSLRLIVIAMTSEPAMMNGARVSRRIIIATDCCTMLVSLVMRVISEGVPSLSSSACERVLMCAKSARRILVPTPCDALEAKYWVNIALDQPSTASSTSSPPIAHT